ncbi:hypothetical protein [Succinivibrio dextrinosolvens]|jgi:uncharacterized protein YceK|uniref:hypothetical protein n=1 Tax=Succinivibrio dextrinosolvens TaxID=83771 RepID=UPI00241DAA48|nr:hypothetical protein [Succinivibrio dextrinosolvens]MBE6423108.1 hypothetical protein [Succinivibrio dextrinosolvens]
MKKIFAVFMTVIFLTGCASQPQLNENNTEILETAEAPAEQENVETQEPEKGFAYYAYVGVGTVLYVGAVILNEIVSHHH